MAGATEQATAARSPEEVTLEEIEQFIYREARYADEHQYDAWEALWTDDAIYWVPAGAEDIDPTKHVSVIYDNRSRIATRVKQYHTGERYAQTPPSRLRRVISNIEILGIEGDDIRVGANFMLAECRARGTTFWAGRYEYKLRPTEDGLRMSFKKVVLVDHDQPLYTLGFLI